MLLSTLQTVPNKQFEVLGLVEGSTVQSKHIGRDLAHLLKLSLVVSLKVTQKC